ncbi:MAG: TonB-dependent receptor, partial [Odoribacter sp.]|nr:TonB-dependent receptor [Odoribacter sp.]
MKMWIKYRVLFLGLICLGIPRCAEAQTRTDADTTREAVLSVLRHKKNWSDIYSMRSVFLFDRGLLGEETGVYTSSNGFVGNAGLLMIRGVSSVNLNTSPYVFVDGLPTRQAPHIAPFASGVLRSNLMFINPLDIAQMRVVKNGYDNVFYGGRAANGIIEVEIDKGTIGTATFDVDLRVGITDADFSPALMNAAEFRAYLYEMMQDKGIAAGELQQNPLFDPLQPAYGHDTYWPGILGRKGMFSDVHVKMKGGDGDTHYLFSIGYTKENEVLKEAHDQRINMRFNLDFKISPKVKITNLFAYNYGNNRFWGEGTNWLHNPLYVSATKAPFLSKDYYSEEGVKVEQLAGVDALGRTNPAALLAGLTNKGLSNKVDALVRANWSIRRNTSANAEVMVTYNSLTEKMHQPAAGIAPDRYIERQNAKRSYSEYLMRWRAWAEHHGNIGTDWNYNAQAGFSIDNYKEKMIFGRTVNAASDEMESLEKGKFADSINNTRYDHNQMNFYLSGGMTWRNKVRLGANFNLERSSNFGPDGAWNLYAGAEVRWTALQTPSEFLEVFGQYGRTGNNDVRGGYYARLYKSTAYYTYGGVYLGNVKNDDLRPEFTHNYDAGVNVALFRNLLEIGASYYYRRTVGLITRKSLPIEVGLDPQYENNGVVSNQGVEFSVAVNPIRDSRWKWSVFATISTLKNKVVSLKNGEVVSTMDQFTSVARKGEELGAFYGYKVKGIFNSADEINVVKSDGSAYQPGDYRME